jgi:hypothetical protein
LATGAVTDITSGLPTTDFYSGGDFDASGMFYAFQFTTKQLVRIDPPTGAVTVIGPSPLGGAQVWEGLTYDHSTGNWYGLSTDITTAQIYSVNITTGATTPIGAPITGDAGGMITMSANCEGQLYGYSILSTNENFYAIDKTTGAATLIGPMGFDANYAQDMDFDPETDICYIGCFNNTAFNGELRTVNVSTGATTLIGATGYEHTAFGIDGLCGGGGVPCSAIMSIQTTCKTTSHTTVNARVNLLGTDYIGMTVTIMIDEDLYTALIKRSGPNSRATVKVEGVYAAGDHLVSLVDPPGCGLGTKHATCSSADESDPAWDDDAEWADAPQATKLLGNYPNPFNPTTNIQYTLGEQTHVTLRVYNTLGQVVATLVNDVQAPGYKSIVWNGKNDSGAPVASGLYIYTLTAGNVVKSDRMLFMK